MEAGKRGARSGPHFSLGADRPPAVQRSRAPGRGWGAPAGRSAGHLRAVCWLQGPALRGAPVKGGGPGHRALRTPQAQRGSAPPSPRTELPAAIRGRDAIRVRAAPGGAEPIQSDAVSLGKRQVPTAAGGRADPCGSAEPFSGRMWSRFRSQCTHHVGELQPLPPRRRPQPRTPRSSLGFPGSAGGDQVGGAKAVL